MPLYKNVDGVQVQMSAQEEANTLDEWAAVDQAKLDTVTNPLTYVLDGVKFRELILDDSREAEVNSLVLGLGTVAKTKARAYLEGSAEFKWDDPQVQWLASNLTEGTAAFQAAWVAKGQE